MSKICPCPNPPGGQIVCEDNQFGMCAYRDGKKVGGCLSIPSSIASIVQAEEKKLATINWMLSQITGNDRSSDSPIGVHEKEMLRSGVLRGPGGVILVRFTLPDDFEIDSTTVTIAAY